MFRGYVSEFDSSLLWWACCIYYARVCFKIWPKCRHWGDWFFGTFCRWTSSYFCLWSEGWVNLYERCANHKRYKWFTNGDSWSTNDVLKLRRRREIMPRTFWTYWIAISMLPCWIPWCCFKGTSKCLLLLQQISSKSHRSIVYLQTIIHAKAHFQQHLYSMQAKKKVCSL